MQRSSTPEGSGSGPSGQGLLGTAHLLYRFADFRLDLARLELSRGERVLNVEAKVLQLLACLVERPGEVWTKDELLERVWPGRVVTEGTLAKAVMKLRAALADDAQELVRTVHGFGYRFGVEVETGEAPAQPVTAFEPRAGEPVPQRPNWRLLHALDPELRGLVWLAEHSKTRDRRVFKFARDGESLVRLKREITLYRVVHEALGAEAPVVCLHDWNLQEPPFFTESEWVEGGDFGQWLAAESPPLAERLEAMAQLCEAVSATHAVGVVHKDLKPGNVLIRRRADARLQVLLADFGIGALSDAGAIEALGITRLGFTGTRIGSGDSSGTPLYLAPEVIGGAVPTQRSDLYALGVMLYQMAVGDLRRPLAPGWERDIEDPLLREDIAAAADVEPERRLADAGELGRRLRRIEERRARRQAEASARDEAQRLQRALAEARLRRRRLSWASAVLLVVLSVVSVLAAQTRIAQENAQVEADTAKAINDFLIQDLLAQANPMVAGRRDVGVRELLDAAAGKVGERFADRPGSAAGVRLALGSAYRNLAEHDAAAQQLETALSLAGAHPEAARYADFLTLELSQLRILQDRPAEAAPLLEPLLGRGDAAVSVQAAVTLAHALEKLGDFDSSMRHVSAALGGAEPGSALAAAALGQKGVTLIGMGRYPEAIEVNREHLAAKQHLYGEGDIRTLEAVRNTALSLYYAQRFDEALAVNQEAHRIAAQVLGPDHDQALVVAADIALVHQEMGDLDRAEALMRATLETRVTIYGEDSRDARTLLNNLGVLYGDLGRHELEIDYLERAWRAEVRASGESHPDALISAHNLGRALFQRQRYAEAESMQRNTVRLALDSLGPEHPYVGIMDYMLAQILSQLDQLEEAEQRVERAVRLLTATMGEDNSFTQRATKARDEILLLRAGASTAVSGGERPLP